MRESASQAQWGRSSRAPLNEFTGLWRREAVVVDLHVAIVFHDGVVRGLGGY